LIPDRSLGPYNALNPHSIWILVILIMAISASGYIAVRLVGVRFGLPIAGLASGFISSAATIAAMGARVAKSRTVLAAAVAGAVLSSVATIVQLAMVLAATSIATLRGLSVSLISAGIGAVIYGAIFTIRALRQPIQDEVLDGRAFSLSTAVVFAVTLSSIMVLSAALREWFGQAGIIVAAGLAGFVDTHSAAISVASLVASGKMSASEAILPILAGFSTNTISKVFLAIASGSRPFAFSVIPGLLVVALLACYSAQTFLGTIEVFALAVFVCITEIVNGAVVDIDDRADPGLQVRVWECCWLSGNARVGRSRGKSRS
jgi:uncharacterized membrane protein (DUF4010 family)